MTFKEMQKEPIEGKRVIKALRKQGVHVNKDMLDLSNDEVLRVYGAFYYDMFHSSFSGLNDQLPMAITSPDLIGTKGYIMIAPDEVLDGEDQGALLRKGIAICDHYGVKRFIMISEVWVTPKEGRLPWLSPSEQPNRQEMLVIALYHKKGLNTMMFNIVRDEKEEKRYLVNKQTGEEEWTLGTGALFPNT